MFEDVKNCGSGKFVSRGEWLHPDRVIDSWEVIFVTSGCVYIQENEVAYQLGKNDILLLEAGMHHYGYKKSVNTSFYWVHFTEAPPIDPALKYQHSIDSYNLSLLFKQLMHYRAENIGSESLDYLTRLILIELFRKRTPKEISHIANKAAAWITANRDVLLKVKQVAEYLGYNVDYLNRVFKENYGKTIKEFIDEEKNAANQNIADHR